MRRRAVLPYGLSLWAPHHPVLSDRSSRAKKPPKGSVPCEVALKVVRLGSNVNMSEVCLLVFSAFSFSSSSLFHLLTLTHTTTCVDFQLRHDIAVYCKATGSKHPHLPAKHPHLLAMYGAVTTSNSPILVFEYAPRGSVQDVCCV